MKELRRIGYDKDILYGAVDFESSEIFKCEKTSFELTKINGCNKIIAEYRFNQLKFNRDQLLNIIEDLYEDLFIRYGCNARIFLYLAYDNNDVSIGNWACRTQWDSDMKYKVKWGKDYYSKRLSNMNEEISRGELIFEFKPRIEYARCIHEKIVGSVEVDQYDLSELIALFCDSENTIRRIFIEVSDIGVGDIEIERYAVAAVNYICDVDLLVSEILRYTKRGEQETFIRYWVETKLNDCSKSYSKYINEAKDLEQGLV